MKETLGILKRIFYGCEKPEDYDRALRIIESVFSINKTKFLISNSINRKDLDSKEKVKLVVMYVSSCLGRLEDTKEDLKNLVDNKEYFSPDASQ